MTNKIFTVAILGVGSRGGNAYGRVFNRMKDKFRIVALCDPREARLESFGEEFGVPKDMRFTDEGEFMKEKRADALLIATYDCDHKRQCIRAFELGYKVLLEKSIATSLEECKELMAAQRELSGEAAVCHVLRYSPIYQKAEELLRGGTVGRLVTIEAYEPVGYWHQAHSFVRGNARSTVGASPMILAKCCHDLDLICNFAGAECVSASSMGGLTFFTEENAPENTAERCTDCRLLDECPYSAKRLYIERWKQNGSPSDEWPTNMVTAAPVTEEKLIEAISDGQYGRCVFRCDNDAVDHQTVLMKFKNGVNATLTMTAFTAERGRCYKFHGTYGQITVTDKEIKIDRYGEEPETVGIDSLVDKRLSHGGGDVGLINSFYAMLCGEGTQTDLDSSYEGYLIGFAAEKSRLSGGKLVSVHGDC